MDDTEWISVDDSPPPREEPVLGYDEFYERVNVAIWEHDRRDDEGKPRLVFVLSDDCHITHWRPLPAGPGKDAK